MEPQPIVSLGTASEDFSAKLVPDEQARVACSSLRMVDSAVEVVATGRLHSIAWGAIPRAPAGRCVGLTRRVAIVLRPLCVASALLLTCGCAPSAIVGGPETDCVSLADRVVEIPWGVVAADLPRSQFECRLTAGRELHVAGVARSHDEFAALVARADKLTSLSPMSKLHGDVSVAVVVEVAAGVHWAELRELLSVVSALGKDTCYIRGACLGLESIESGLSMAQPEFGHSRTYLLPIRLRTASRTANAPTPVTIEWRRPNEFTVAIQDQAAGGLASWPPRWRTHWAGSSATRVDGVREAEFLLNCADDTPAAIPIAVIGWMLDSGVLVLFADAE